MSKAKRRKMDKAWRKRISEGKKAAAAARKRAHWERFMAGFIGTLP